MAGRDGSKRRGQAMALRIRIASRRLVRAAYTHATLRWRARCGGSAAVIVIALPPRGSCASRRRGGARAVLLRHPAAPSLAGPVHLLLIGSMRRLRRRRIMRNSRLPDLIATGRGGCRATLSLV